MNVCVNFRWEAGSVVMPLGRTYWWQVILSRTYLYGGCPTSKGSISLSDATIHRASLQLCDWESTPSSCVHTRKTALTSFTLPKKCCKTLMRNPSGTNRTWSGFLAMFTWRNGFQRSTRMELLRIKLKMSGKTLPGLAWIRVKLGEISL